VYVISAFFATLILVAMVFLLANAGFLFITQLLLYAGAVTVLFVFTLMLSRRTSQERNLESKTYNWVAGIGIGALAMGGFLSTLKQNFGKITHKPLDDVKIIGTSVVSSYLFAFELLAVFLLIALILAAVIIGKKQEK
jgi:NADH-quinone oxidoreductase subunit J